jgi:hypothetical protein
MAYPSAQVPTFEGLESLADSATELRRSLVGCTSCPLCSLLSLLDGLVNFKLRHYRTFVPVDAQAGSVLICDYTGKEVVE